jgi:uncharacterized protein
MRLEWDEAKRRINLTRHGIDFAALVNVFDGPTFTIVDDRYDYGEERLLTSAFFKGRVVVIVHTRRDDTIRLISARKARRYEEIQYFKELWN